MKISSKIEDENNNLTIFNNDEEENENIFPIQAYISNSTRCSYLQPKSQQALTNTNGEQPPIPSLSTLSKSIVQN